jgi:hypothetical protein
MVKETFIFNQKIEKFIRLVEFFKKEHNVEIFLAEISGKRWSYVAGIKSDSLLPVQRIKLNEKYGLVITNFGNLPIEKQFEVIREIRKVLEIDI